MPSSILDQIAQHQSERERHPGAQTPPHRPRMLYIGCIDARVSINEGIGIRDGDALIERVIAAFVPPYGATGEKLPPQASAVPAAIEFFIHNFPQPTDAGGKAEPKVITVSGHTDCGGLKACQGGHLPGHYEHLGHYIHLLDGVRETVMTRAKAEGWSDERVLHELEYESVRQSLANLMTYPAVAQAVAKGELALEGWVHDIKEERILTMDPDTKAFAPMHELPAPTQRAAAR